MATEFRVSLTVDDFEAAVAFYTNVLGFHLSQDWTTPQGRCVVLSVSKATIEIIDEAQARLIDDAEVGKRVSGQVRFAFQFSDVYSATELAKAGGASLIRPPTETPWKDVNARLLGPDKMQMTFFSTPKEAPNL
jgi:catechol 2,3-dioxygenase-like lactoylglutathione lyase family enzyme